MPLFLCLSDCEYGFIMFCTVFSVLSAVFIGVSLNNFVVLLVSFPLYVKVAHFVFRCCGSVFLFVHVWWGVSWFGLCCVCFPLYVKVAHFVFWCCGSVFLFVHVWWGVFWFSLMLCLLLYIMPFMTHNFENKF
jgi:hypothetical protein